jgi:hypothetical protein
MIIAGMKRRSYGCLFLLADKNTIILLISANKKTNKRKWTKNKKIRAEKNQRYTKKWQRNLLVKQNRRLYQTLKV